MKNLMGVALLATLALTACGDPAPSNTDPRRGPVDVGNWVHKVCDGAALIYSEDSGRGVSVVPNSPECAR